MEVQTIDVIATVQREQDPAFVSPVEEPPLDVFEMDRDGEET